VSAAELPPIVAGDDYPLTFTYAGTQEGNSMRIVVKATRGAANALVDRTVAAANPDASQGIIRTPLTQAETLSMKGLGVVWVQAQRLASGQKRTPLLIALPVLDPV
jgi:hypothetical protein